MSGIIANSLSVSIGDSTLLAGLSLTLETGAFTVIIGPNGAGKTTLIKALLGLIKHDGVVQFGSEARSAMHRMRRAKFASYLPQGQDHVWPISVRDVVALGRYPHGEATSAGDKDANGLVDELLDRLGLTPLVDRSVLALSGGEQMRVSLARALAVEAKFLFADEPLASLDPHFQFSIMDMLRAEADQGVGVVAVLHDLGIAARYADRLILLNEGQVEADGTPSDVLSEALMRRVFGVDARRQEVPSPHGERTVFLPEAPLAADAPLGH